MSPSAALRPASRALSDRSSGPSESGERRELKRAAVGIAPRVSYAVAERLCHRKKFIAWLAACLFEPDFRDLVGPRAAGRRDLDHVAPALAD